MKDPIIRETYIIETLHSLAHNSPEEIMETICKDMDPYEKSTIWMFERNFYNVFFQNPRLLFPIIDFIKLYMKSIPTHLESEFDQLFSIQLLSKQNDEYSTQPYESSSFYGFLDFFGFVDSTEQLQKIDQFLSSTYDSLHFGLIIELLPPIIFPFFQKILIKAPKILDFCTETYVNEIKTLKNLLEKNEFDIMKITLYQKENKNVNSLISISKSHLLHQILWNDDLFSLQQMTFYPNFDFNQKVESSCTVFQSIVYDAPLIFISAIYRAIKCFKFLMLNGSDLKSFYSIDGTLIPLGTAAVIGGNIEIIHICYENHFDFTNSSFFAAEYYHNELFEWIIENNLDTEIETDLLYESAFAGNNLVIAEKLLQKNPNYKIQTSLLEVVCQYDSYNILNLIKIYNPSILTEEKRKHLRKIAEQFKSMDVLNFLDSFT